MDNYAIALYSIVDARKVDLRSPQLPQLAEHLGAFLTVKHQISALDWRIEVLGEGPYLIANAVSPESLPAFFALADVQKTQLYRYRRNRAEQAELIAVAIDPQALN